MAIYQTDVLKFVAHMPEDTYRPFRDYVYQEAYDSKLKVNAIERDLASGVLSEYDSEVSSVLLYDEFINQLKDVCAVSRLHKEGAMYGTNNQCR